MNYGSIYIIENNVNNKVYIGQTIASINHRFQQHKTQAKLIIKYDKYYKIQTKFTRALNKYGCNNFKIKSLRQCSDKEELDYYEEQCI